MPKNFGTNTKSADARARKEAVKQANERDKQQRLEDEYWRDDDKQVQKKQQRKVIFLPRNLRMNFGFYSIIVQSFPKFFIYITKLEYIENDLSVFYFI